MRGGLLERVVVASLGVSVVITLGCDIAPFPTSPTPTPPATFSVLSMFPAEGLIVGGTVTRIAGTGFQSGDTVTVDGSRVDATVDSAYTISLTMPAHAAGKVDVTVIRALSQVQAGVPGGYAYVVTTGPVISELLPNIGSTGGTPITIRGTGFRSGLTVSVDGIVLLSHSLFNSTTLEFYAPGHAAGTVEVIVTNPDGQAGRGEFTYASPATFDFNGDWQGRADWFAFGEAPFVMTIRDNMVVSVSCGASTLTLDPPPVVANGAFSFAGSGGVFIRGKILSPIFAEGAINMASCPDAYWSAEKK
jgi:hypothetical protein